MTTDQKGLDTVEISLRQADLLNILQRHDTRGDEWSLVGLETKFLQHRTLELWIDGSATPTQIRLNSDGTWTVATHHLLGEA